MYVDEICQVAINQDPQNVTSGTTTENLCERFFYVLQNANFNVQAVTDTNGNLIERYEYTPYGERTLFTRNWALEDMKDDGQAGIEDLNLLLTRYGDTTCPASRADLTGDGAIGGGDTNLLLICASGSSLPWSADPKAMRPVQESARGVSLTDAGDRQLLTVGLCDFGHQGLPHDREFNHAVENRHRTYWPHLSRWGQIDPTGYPDGMNGFEYERRAVTQARDPLGLVSSTVFLRFGRTKTRTFTTFSYSDKEDKWTTKGPTITEGSMVIERYGLKWTIEAPTTEAVGGKAVFKDRITSQVQPLGPGGQILSVTTSISVDKLWKVLGVSAQEARTRITGELPCVECRAVTMAVDYSVQMPKRSDLAKAVMSEAIGLLPGGKLGTTIAKKLATALSAAAIDKLTKPDDSYRTIGVAVLCADHTKTLYMFNLPVSKDVQNPVYRKPIDYEDPKTGSRAKVPYNNSSIKHVVSNITTRHLSTKVTADYGRHIWRTWYDNMNIVGDYDGP